MRILRNRRLICFLSLVAWAAIVTLPICAAQGCRQFVIEGQVNAGAEWEAPIGEGWVFRLVPIPPLQAGYSGWDLVVDRERPAGFPDALYLATPPYNSINQREIGTTYGLRAQDAIGWNPRSFRFLTDPAALRRAQREYALAFELHKDPVKAESIAAASAELLKLGKTASSGELKILDARLVPGTADPATFAQQWARAASRTGYQVEPSSPGQSSPRGTLRWMRFQLTLWLPSGWEIPPGRRATSSRCAP